jgi:mRNA interferase MazF
VVARFDPAEGAEQAKTRPAIVVSNNGANTAAARLGYGTVTVIPLTSALDPPNRGRLYHVELEPDETGARLVSTAQAEHVRSLAISRVERIIGMLGPAAMSRVDAALRTHLSLD